MWSVAIYTALAAFILIGFGTGCNPFVAIAQFIKQLMSSKRYFLHVGAVIIILFFNKVELRIEEQLLTTTDFTALFHSFEGNIVHSIQQLFQHRWLTPLLAFMYVVVFQALMLASLAVYLLNSQRNRLFYATCYAIMLNYCIAIPFFLFFPVHEVWSYQDSGVRFLMLDVFPAFETEYRLLSGLDNCFPSLHTSMSVTLAILACYSSNRRWAYIVCGCSTVILFSIFYLGIHWISDMIGGILLGLLASVTALRLSELTLYPKRKPAI